MLLLGKEYDFLNRFFFLRGCFNLVRVIDDLLWLICLLKNVKLKKIKKSCVWFLRKCF